MNRATRVTVSVLGTIFGFSGISHGFFELLQGNAPTGGLFISAIGKSQRMWPHGDEFALTFIPNFLVTGTAAMLVGLAIVIWSVGFVHGKKGPIILLLLFVLLLMVGGGVAQILFFPWIWLVSTRINRPLIGWKKSLPRMIQVLLAKLWPWDLVFCAVLLLSIFAIAITGFVPTVKDPEAVLSVMLTCLAATTVFLPLTFISGFAYDIATKPAIARKEN